MGDSDMRRRLHDHIRQRMLSGQIPGGESNSSCSGKGPVPNGASDEGRGTATGNCSGGVCSGRSAERPAAGAEAMTSQDYAYVDMVRSLVSSICNSPLVAGRVAYPKFGLLPSGEIKIAIDSLQLPPMPSKLCTDQTQRRIEAVQITKLWLCLAIATIMPYDIALARSMTGALSMGTEVD